MDNLKGPQEPEIDPARVRRTLRPIVRHGMRELQGGTRPEHVLSEVAMMGWLVGQGMGADQAIRLVERNELEWIGATGGRTGEEFGGYPYGQMPYGQAPYGQMPYGQTPYGQMPYGQAPYGQMPYGKAPGSAPYGQAPFAKAPYGQAPMGKAPMAKAPMGKGAPLPPLPTPVPAPWVMPMPYMIPGPDWCCDDYSGCSDS